MPGLDAQGNPYFVLRKVILFWCVRCGQPWRDSLAGVARYVRGRRSARDVRPAGQRRLVLFRTHVADPLTVRAASQMAASLEASRYDLCVMYDSDAIPDAPRRFGTLNETVAFEGVSLADMLGRYPAVHRRSALIKSHYKQLAYALVAARRGVEASSFVWGVEHDVALTGGRWRALFEAHDDVDARSLLASRVGWAPKLDPVHGGGAWNLAHIHGPGFAHTPLADVAFMFGSITRYSGRFAAHLDALARGPSPTYGHSEAATPSLCNATSWCSMGNLSSAWVGLNEYQLPRPITSEVFEELEALAPDKLFHPVRDTGSASSSSALKRATGRVAGRVGTTEASNVARCVLANPRPHKPSYSCPVGCRAEINQWGYPEDYRGDPSEPPRHRAGAVTGTTSRRWLFDFHAGRLPLAPPADLPHGQLPLGRPRIDVRAHGRRGVRLQMQEEARGLPVRCKNGPYSVTALLHERDASPRREGVSRRRS